MLSITLDHMCHHSACSDADGEYVLQETVAAAMLNKQSRTSEMSGSPVLGSVRLKSLHQKVPNTLYVANASDYRPVALIGKLLN
jgi:hypothetical protein